MIALKPYFKGLYQNGLIVLIIHTSSTALIILLDIRNFNGIWLFWKDPTNEYSDLSINNIYDQRAFSKAIGDKINLVHLIDAKGT